MERERRVREVMLPKLTHPSAGLRCHTIQTLMEKLTPAGLARHADVVVAMFEDSSGIVRQFALQAIGKLEPAALAQHVNAVLARLEDHDGIVRLFALQTLSNLTLSELALYADAVVEMLVDDSHHVREVAWAVLYKLGPATIAQHVDTVVDILEDSIAEDDDLYDDTRQYALLTLGKLESATLAPYAEKVIWILDIFGAEMIQHLSEMALEVLDKLEPATLAQHAAALIAVFVQGNFEAFGLRGEAMRLLRKLPCYLIRDFDFDDSTFAYLQPRLLRRQGWYKLRLRLRVERLALYWYALPYRPSGPGHARDVEAWDRMIE